MRIVFWYWLNFCCLHYTNQAMMKVKQHEFSWKDLMFSFLRSGISYRMIFPGGKVKLFFLFGKYKQDTSEYEGCFGEKKKSVLVCAFFHFLALSFNTYPFLLPECCLCCIFFCTQLSFPLNLRQIQSSSSHVRPNSTI